MSSFFNALFGCGHRRTSFPITSAKRSAGGTHSGSSKKATYVVCLDCGQEFNYDWKAMRIVANSPLRVPPAVEQVTAGAK